jgi:hypothetical protein
MPPFYIPPVYVPPRHVYRAPVVRPGPVIRPPAGSHHHLHHVQQPPAQLSGNSQLSEHLQDGLVHEAHRLAEELKSRAELSELGFLPGPFDELDSRPALVRAVSSIARKLRRGR